mmetsp:Transcript_2185/g.5091  ORF Transcript_2185/g.5091 Transcript_2185/m.5091 type:complete len:230 (+) Transcript_2185:296-985(+)
MLDGHRALRSTGGTGNTKSNSTKSGRADRRRDAVALPAARLRIVSKEFDRRPREAGGRRRRLFAVRSERQGERGQRGAPEDLGRARRSQYCGTPAGFYSEADVTNLKARTSVVVRSRERRGRHRERRWVKKRHATAVALAVHRGAVPLPVTSLRPAFVEPVVEPLPGLPGGFTLFITAQLRVFILLLRAERLGLAATRAADPGLREGQSIRERRLDADGQRPRHGRAVW